MVVTKSLSPRDTDIILGKGGTATHHPGNKCLRQQLMPLKIRYQNMKRNTEKGELVDSILQSIIESGKKFYKKDEESPHKFRIVGLDEKFRDGKLIIRHKIKNLLSAKVTAAAAAAAVTVNGDRSKNVGGQFLYFQTMRDNNKNCHLRMGAPATEKAKYRGMLSEPENVVSQLNINVDPHYQIYIVPALHITPHSVEDNCNREQCRILEQQYNATITEMSKYNIGIGEEVVQGIASNYTSTSPMLQQLVGNSFTSNCMEDLAEYLSTNGSFNPNRDVGAGSKRVYIGFGQVQKWSETKEGQKMPTFNCKHLQNMSTHLQSALAKILSFSQMKLNEQFPSANATGSLNSRKQYVRSKWQNLYNVHEVKVDWDFEFVDINMRCPGEGKLLRHCDYKNDWRSNNDGCVVFSYSVLLRGKKHRVVMVMTSRYSVGAPFERIEAKKKSVISNANISKKRGVKRNGTVTKQCDKKRRYPKRRK